MKKFYLISLVCAAMMFVSCGKKATLENSIPNDAVMVMRFDVKSMIAKSEYNLFDNQLIKVAVEGMKLALKEPQKNLLDNFLKDANSFGINIKGDAYLYMNEQVMGILLSVNDAKKVFENLKTIDPSFEMSITQEKGVYSIGLGGQKIAWDKEKMMFLINYAQYLGVNQEEIDYFNLPKSKSIVSDVNYQKFAKTKGDISLYYSMANYANFMKNFANLGGGQDPKVQEMMDKVMTIYENFGGVSVALNCNFEKGKIVASAQTLYATKEDEKRFAEIYDYSGAKLTGEFLKYIPQNPLFLAAMNFDGEKVFAMLEKIGLISFFDEMLTEIDEDMELELDYKALIKSINGDIMMSFYNGNLTNEAFTAAGSMFVKLKDVAPMQTLIDTINASGIGEVKDMPVPVDFGIKDDFFYIVMKGGLVEKENDLVKKIKNQPMFIYGDLSDLNEILKPLYEKDADLKMFAGIIGKGLTLVETYESKYIDNNKGEFVINFTDKKENSLKQIFGFIDEIVNSAGSIFGSSLFGGSKNYDDDDYDDDEEEDEVDFEF